MTKEANEWLRNVNYYNQQGSYYGKIAILMVIYIILRLGKKVIMLDKYSADSTKQFGSGIYEGQVDKEGNACGQGKWKCTEPTDHWNYKGTIIEGSFKDNLPDGFGEHLHLHYSYL